MPDLSILNATNQLVSDYFVIYILDAKMLFSKCSPLSITIMQIISIYNSKCALAKDGKKT